VLILLIDLAANGHLGTSTRLRFLTGKGKIYIVIDIRDRVSVIGADKTKGLIGLHDFTGADWGGKFVGVSKKTLISNYLSLRSNDEIVRTFTSMGHDLNSDPTACNDLLDDGNLPAQYRPLEHFVCKMLSQQSTIDMLPSLRCELFRKKNLEVEKLPPTQRTLIPHILRANYMSQRDKSHNTAKPLLPALEHNGWEINTKGKYVPVMCLKEPAPKAVLELVKCGCQGNCDSANCSCLKNGLSCTALCKCSDCSNVQKLSLCEDIDDTDL